VFQPLIRVGEIDRAIGSTRQPPDQGLSRSFQTQTFVDKALKSPAVILAIKDPVIEALSFEISHPSDTFCSFLACSRLAEQAISAMAKLADMHFVGTSQAALFFNYRLINQLPYMDAGPRMLHWPMSASRPSLQAI
jgi:hypothetical protein